MNPVFPGWYADPELHIFQGRYFLYPTYSAPYDDQTFFEVWSSSDLVNWRNDGRILDFADVPWNTNRWAWAPSVIERHGQYFFYFSAGDGAGLGVAVAEHPAGLTLMRFSMTTGRRTFTLAAGLMPWSRGSPKT